MPYGFEVGDKVLYNHGRGINLKAEVVGFQEPNDKSPKPPEAQPLVMLKGSTHPRPKKKGEPTPEPVIKTFVREAKLLVKAPG